ncbi:MAG: hypothetical protein AAF402_04035 [Pseudomonadota bacterium]
MNKTKHRESGKVEELLSSGKTLDRAFILPVIGLILLVTPVANIFRLETHVAGVPFAALYLFVVWGSLIGGAALLARKLRQYSSDRQSPDVNLDNSD